jgi:transcriptional regulator with XRE-family HTH domain
MPNIHKDASAWETALAARVGRAVYTRRKALKLTAQQLAQRTADLGYPITRVAVSKIEGGTRAGKFDIAELVILAKALEMPPVLLLYPGFPEGHRATVDSAAVTLPRDVELFPGTPQSSRDALLWFCGRLPSLGLTMSDEQLDELERSHPGGLLIETDAFVTQQAGELGELRGDLDRMLAADAEPEAAEKVRRQIRRAKQRLAQDKRAVKAGQAELWGGRQTQQTDRTRRQR